MAERFADKVVLVTGAASGIGAATARRFAGEGAKLMLGDVDAEHEPDKALRAVYGDAAVKIDGESTPLVDTSHWSLLARPVVERGAGVFAENCASCHSSVKPRDGAKAAQFYRDHLRQRVDIMFASDSA